MPPLSLAGEATGANLRVILKAFRDLIGFRLRLTWELRAVSLLAVK